jgi:hypothetical protein
MKENNGAGMDNGATNGAAFINNDEITLGGANEAEIVNGANGVTLGAANIGTITIIPGHTVTFAAGITGPVIITNNNGIVLNLQGPLAPSTITSFDDHLDIHPLGAVAEEGDSL